MKIKIQIVLWTIVCMLLYKQSNSTDFNSTKVEQYLNVLCQTTDNCLSKDRTITAIPRRLKNRCCWDCDNENTKEHARQQLERYTECLSPIVSVDGQTTRNEFMYVVNPPDEGCIETPIKDNTGPSPSCSPAVNAGPWGNFYPVYSRDKNINFINEQCAVCHGAKDILRWRANIRYTGKMNKLFNVITNYVDTFNSSDVSIRFEAPNDESKDPRNVCFSVLGNCQSASWDFQIPVSINMSKPEIIKACEQGPSFVYIRLASRAYRNVFCAVCNGKYENRSGHVQCEGVKVDEAWRSDGRTFVSLLKNDFIEQMSNHAPDDIEHKACLPYDKTKKEGNVCRTIVCPTLQVRYPDGKCDYPFETMFIDNLIVTINITSSKRINVLTKDNLTETDIRSAFERFSPWSSSLGNFIASIGYRTDKYYDSGSEFLVHFSFKINGGVNTREFLQHIKFLLTKPWIVWIDERIEFTQEMFRHGVFKRVTSINGVDPQEKLAIPVWAISQNYNGSLHGLSVPKWNIIYSKNLYKKGVNIIMNKLFYCDKIYLMPEDYKIMTKNFPLYLIRNDRYLFTDEYIAYISDDGNQVILTCLDDTDFAPVGSQNAAPSVEKRHVCVILFIYVLYASTIVA